MKRRVIFLVLIVLTPILLAFFFERVPPSTIGVKQVMWGGGIVAKDHAAGFHIGIGGYHKWYMLPARTHFAHFTSTEAIGKIDSRTSSYSGPLNIRTLDANTVTIDVSVAYRIRADKAHELVQSGAQAEYPIFIKGIIKDKLRSEFASLSSEQLQDTDQRLAMVEKAIPVLNEAMATYYCEAEAVLIRRFVFEPEYEVRLQEKQFLRQKALLDEAQTTEANEQKTVNLIDRQIQAAELQLTQDWEKRIQEKVSEFEVKIAQIAADARVYQQRTLAEGEAGRVIAEANGQLAIEKAEALRNELRTEALNSKGGSILLALEAADNLNMPRVTLNSDDPSVPLVLDLSQLTKLLVGTLEAAASSSNGE